jgi:hypothetical protein
LSETENVRNRRKAYVSREIMRSLSNFSSADEITRQITPVAIRAVSMFDTREYAVDLIGQFFEDECADKTMNAIYFEMLSSAIIQGKKWCDAHHEHPKSCDCQELFKVFLGVVPAVEPLEVESE